jgi:phosphatidylethanolamine/phosphatidyl-N-methylethanolamine N-methyltransferase
MFLQTSYTLAAPVYDFLLNRATAALRRRSLSRLPQHGKARVLISGAGTGLDFPHVYPGHQYTALDFTAAMLQRGKNKARHLQVDWVRGDSMSLPFANESFDCVVLHLILAVVPDSERCLAEAVRVLKPGGNILVFDKFLQRGQQAWLRRSLNFFTAKVATRMNVIFEDVLESTRGLIVVSDEPALAGGWFRLIELRKKNANE